MQSRGMSELQHAKTQARRTEHVYLPTLVVLQGPSAKEVNRDTTSFERARSEWSRSDVSHRGKVRGIIFRVVVGWWQHLPAPAAVVSHRRKVCGAGTLSGCHLPPTCHLCFPAAACSASAASGLRHSACSTQHVHAADQRPMPARLPPPTSAAGTRPPCRRSALAATTGQKPGWGDDAQHPGECMQPEAMILGAC